MKTCMCCMVLCRWGRTTHICVCKLATISSDNGLSPGRGQAIIWTSAGILSAGPLGTNFSDILMGIQIFSFKKMHLKMSSAKWRPIYLGLKVLIQYCSFISRYVYARLCFIVVFGQICYQSIHKPKRPETVLLIYIYMSHCPDELIQGWF